MTPANRRTLAHAFNVVNMHNICIQFLCIVLYNPPTLLYVFVYFSSIETRFIISILRLNCIECPQYVARTARAETVVVKLTTLKVSDTTIKWQFFSLRLLCVPRHLRLDTIAVNRQIELSSSLRCICQAKLEKSYWVALWYETQLSKKVCCKRKAPNEVSLGLHHWLASWCSFEYY